MACNDTADCDRPIDFAAFTNSQFVANIYDPDYVVGTTYKAEVRDRADVLKATFAIAIPSLIPDKTFDMSLTAALLTTVGVGIYSYDLLRIVGGISTRLFGGSFRISNGTTVP